jgi:hypothetical protein
VARLHAGENGQDGAAGDPPSLERPLLRILLDKLGQMQPGMPNLLVVHTGDELARRIDLGGLMQQLKTRVEGKDPAFYAAAGHYATPAAFYKDFLRLSAILLWATTCSCGLTSRPDRGWKKRCCGWSAPRRAPAAPETGAVSLLLIHEELDIYDSQANFCRFVWKGEDDSD